jgi:hypothetical protein
MLFGKDRYKSNPIPYTLYPQIRQEVSLPLLPASSVPASAIVRPKTYKALVAEAAAANPVAMLATYAQEQPTRFPKNLRIQSFVDSREKWKGVPSGRTRSAIMRVIRRH